MKGFIVTVLLALSYGCKVPPDVRAGSLHLVEEAGLQCAYIHVSTGGGLSCNWAAFNNAEED